MLQEFFVRKKEISYRSERINYDQKISEKEKEQKLNGPNSLLGAPNTLQRDKEEGPNSVQRKTNSDQAKRNRTKIARILLFNCTNSDHVRKEFGVNFV